MPVSTPPFYRTALPEDVPACIRLRGLTRENAVSEQRLAELGITAESWSQQVREGRLPGVVAQVGGEVVGYCFGDTGSGEVVVLALLPDFEGRGIGRDLLAQVVAMLRAHGHRRLFLGCSDNPGSRSWGFYRHLGWHPTGRRDSHGDEELEYLCGVTGRG
ncbi:GNAT family N-acetyltransferase [Pelomonas sp. CA6]|uniref:GNAT family N-acetyltransferase n=1 Tax=Pelomonas sp. CA6 TaxID=2907999 RepID=UPI001F4C0ECA|nr:GNAT family N-acetyltransferase [Pelomonas sp. CA6]MCH7345163.1 GNAT family N-acetyltransferase [Pelomonas sp. CA6]